MVKRHERPRSVQDDPARRPGRRHRREGGADPRLQRDAARPQRQQADPGRRPPRRRRQARALREAQRGGDRLMEAHRDPRPRPPRRRACASATSRRSCPALTKKFGYSTPMQAPRLRRSPSTWASARRSRTTRCSKRRRSSWRRSPASSPNVRRARKSIASFKVREGMPVGVSVTLRRARMWEFLDRLCLDRGAAHPRLPRPQPALLRRPRQLLDGRQRAADLPRNRLRLDRRGARPRHHDHDHGRRPTSRPSSCCSALGMPFAQEGRPGQAPTRRREAEEEEEQRKEEARLKAEAEQAALEQLKEENPEAYAKPESRGGRGGRGGAEGARATRPPRAAADEESSEDG